MVAQLPQVKHIPLAYSRPLSLYLPEEFKATDFNRKKGILTAYLTVYNGDDGEPFVDPYLDVVCPGSFTKTIQGLDSFRKSHNNPWLCPNLWQHDRGEITGSVIGLTEDSKGVIYETQFLMSIKRAQDAFDLMEAKMLGSSYGYDPIRYEPKDGLRYLQEIRLREVSQVTFPANNLAGMISTKEDQPQKFFVPSNFPDFSVLDEEEEIFLIKSVTGSTGLPIGPRDESWDAGKARSQYASWGTDDAGKPNPGKYKQVHLQLDGDPKNKGSYKYPFCYIVNGSPQICVGGVKACVSALGGARSADAGGDTSGMLAKCRTMYGRINSKYPNAPKLEVPKDDATIISEKQSSDFMTVWAGRAEMAAMDMLYSMNSAMMHALTEIVDDDDLDGSPTSDQGDRMSAIQNTLNQFATAIQQWLPLYQSADDLNDDLQPGAARVPSADMAGFMTSANLSSLSLKDISSAIKSGRVLSEKNRKRLLSSLAFMRSHMEDLQTLLDETEPEKTLDITQALVQIGTMGQSLAKTTPSPPPQPSAPISFPMLPQVTMPEAPEQDFMLNLLASIKNSLGVIHAPDTT